MFLGFYFAKNHTKKLKKSAVLAIMTKENNGQKIQSNKSFKGPAVTVKFWFNSPTLVRKSQYNTAQLNFAQQMLI